MVNNKELDEYAFGWNALQWLKPVRVSGILNELDQSKTALEIGAGHHSIASLILDGRVRNIDISYFDSVQLSGITNTLEQAERKFTLQSNYAVKYADAFTVTGEYDVVLMKSVLGGLFRANDTSIKDVNMFLNDLCDRTLSDNGILITIDNGISVIEPLLTRFGARCNDWRYFNLSDLESAVAKEGFGFLNAFSFTIRLGSFGKAVDNSILFPLDKILSKIYAKKPTVIMTVFKKY